MCILMAYWIRATGTIRIGGLAVCILYQAFQRAGDELLHLRGVLIYMMSSKGSSAHAAAM